MSYLKYGLYHLGSQCIRRNNLRSTRILARIPLFILLTSQAFSAQAEFISIHGSCQTILPP